MLVIHTAEIPRALRALTLPLLYGDGQAYVQAIEGTPNRQAYFRYSVPWGPTRLAWPLGEDDLLSARVQTGLADAGSYLVTYSHSPYAIVISGVQAVDHLTGKKITGLASRAIGVQVIGMPGAPKQPAAPASLRPRGARPLTVLHPLPVQPASLAELTMLLLDRKTPFGRDPTIMAQLATTEVIAATSPAQAMRPEDYPWGDEGIGQLGHKASKNP